MSNTFENALAELDLAWKRLNDKLQRFGCYSETYVTVTSRLDLSWAKINKNWQVCARERYDNGYDRQTVGDWEPIGECDLERQIAAASAVTKLKEAVVKKSNLVTDGVYKAINILQAYLDK